MVSPLGARCRSPLGGLYRSPLGALDCPGCPETLLVTFSGVDAAYCSACYPAGVGASQNFSGVAFDGGYTVTKSGEQDGGATCIYDLGGPSGPFPVTNIATINNYPGGVSNCTGSPASTNTANASIRVLMTKATRAITSITTNASLLDADPFSWTGTTTLGAAVSNQQTCSTPPSSIGKLSSGGTATVTLS